ncbi:MAG TPA: type IV pilus assembly protein PilM, partial [Acidimicrobiales bacterium]|nr:type IV pilus assembly protein PilM [Acidimicrobiales bacterium]
MSDRHVGLDIGSFAVRAAELSIDAGLPTLHRFAQVTLPPGAVVEGQVTDEEAVAATIRQLWSKGGFKQRRVVVGVSSKDVKVRQAEVPDLPPDEVRGALYFEAPDLIPSAGDEMVLDYLVQDRFTRDGATMLRVLVAAVPKAQIDATLAAVSSAGLDAEAVDLVPFALVRSLASPQADGEGEVIVSVGAGLTSVVVQAGGVPQLVRTTAGGGGAITDAIAARLSMGYEQAEAVKRMASPHTPEGLAAISLIDEQLVVLVREIVGSVDYFVTQAAEAGIERIILTGAGSLVPGLRERIRSESHLDVVPADALRNVALGKTRLTPEQLVAASTTLAGPIGLALAPTTDPASRFMALLPEHHRRRQHARREMRLTVGAVAAVALVLLGFYAQRMLSVHHARSEVARVERLQNLVTGNANGLAQYASEDSDVAKRTKLLQGALTNDINASAVMDQITAALPSDVWLLSVSITMPKGKSPGSAAFSFGGVDRTSAAHWLQAAQTLRGLLGNVWVSSISDQSGHGGVEFASSATVVATSL